jgi:hypothetical protein
MLRYDYTMRPTILDVVEDRAFDTCGAVATKPILPFVSGHNAFAAPLNGMYIVEYSSSS